MFDAGMGWDAAVVAEVDRARALGREATPLRYAATALGQYLRERRRPRALSVEIPEAGPVDDIEMAFVCNTDTWTYLGSRAVRTNPGTTFGSGLGLFGLHDLRARAVAPALRQMLIARWRPARPRCPAPGRRAADDGCAAPSRSPCRSTVSTSARAARSGSAPCPRRYASSSETRCSSQASGVRHPPG